MSSDIDRRIHEWHKEGSRIITALHQECKDSSCMTCVHFAQVLIDADLTFSALIGLLVRLREAHETHAAS